MISELMFVGILIAILGFMQGKAYYDVLKLRKEIIVTRKEMLGAYYKVFDLLKSMQDNKKDPPEAYLGNLKL